MSVPGLEEIERGVRTLWNFVESWVPNPKTVPTPRTRPPVQNNFPNMAMFPAAEIFTRLAGLSGAAAVILGAYGAHSFRQKGTPEARETFETGNRYHLIHSVVLGLAPFTRNPRLTGALLVGGMVFFSGGCYGYALAQNKLFRQVTPFGGVLLILAWLSMVL